MVDSLAPALLIAVPQLLDPNFHHSVVLLIEHSDEGALGVVVNRFSTVKVGEVMENLGFEYGGDPEVTVLVGGPVQPESGMVIHAEGNEPADSRPVTDSIFVGSTLAALRRLFRGPRSRAIFLLGHAGWGAGQLEGEIEAGAWIPVPVSETLIFDADRPGLWERALREQGIDPRFLVRGDSDTGLN
jgi:putative transcriptional regulator